MINLKNNKFKVAIIVFFLLLIIVPSIVFSIIKIIKILKRDEFEDITPVIKLVFNDKTYDGISHIVDIPLSEIEYSIDQKCNIVRNVYKYNSCEETSEYDNIKEDKIRKKELDIDIDSYLDKKKFLSGSERLDIGYTTIGIEKSGILYYKLCYVSGSNPKNNVFGKNYKSNKVLISPYINRKWISYNDLEPYLLNGTKINKFNVLVKYCRLQNYEDQNTMKFEFTTEKDISSNELKGDLTADNLYFLLNMKKDGSDLLNFKKRNMLACLWYDNKIVLENFKNENAKYCNDVLPLIEITSKDTTKGVEDYEGPCYSPYITINFDTPENAKFFVANVLNKIQETSATLITPTTTEATTTTTEATTTTTEATTTTTEATTTTTEKATTTTDPNVINLKQIKEVELLPFSENFSTNNEMINNNISLNSLSLIADSHYLS
jgi:hypothetical protein